MFFHKILFFSLKSTLRLLLSPFKTKTTLQPIILIIEIIKSANAGNRNWVFWTTKVIFFQNLLQALLSSPLDHTHQANVPFLYPWKHPKTSSYLFSGSVEIKHWPEIDWKKISAWQILRIIIVYEKTFSFDKNGFKNFHSRCHLVHSHDCIIKLKQIPAASG